MLVLIFRFLDRFIPPELRTTDLDAHRRCRLLVACCFGLTLFAQPFLYEIITLQGYVSPTAWVFIIGSILSLLNPFLLRYTGSHRIPGVLFSLEVIAALAAMAYFNGGYRSASLVWNPAVPLLATGLVGAVWAFKGRFLPKEQQGRHYRAGGNPGGIGCDSKCGTATNTLSGSSKLAPIFVPLLIRSDHAKCEHGFHIVGFPPGPR